MAKGKITIEMNPQSKAFLDEVAALMSVSKDTVAQVWEYTLVNWLLKMEDKKDGGLASLVIPYLGSLGVRFKENRINRESGKIESDVDVFFAVDDQFKRLYYEVCQSNIDGVANLLRENYVRPLLKQD